MTQLEETVKKAAQEKAAEIIRQATAAARQIDSYEDAHLTRIVRQHLAGIAPGMRRDR